MIILQRKLPFYRKHLFEKLSLKRNIQLILLEAPKFEIELKKDSKVSVINYKTIFSFYLLNIFQLRKYNFKVIIIEADLRLIFVFIYYIFFTNKKIFLWGLWKTGNEISNFIRKKLIFFVDGAIFYAPSHLKYFSKYRKNKKYILAKNSLFVNEKTTQDSYKIKFNSRNSFIFVGSLNKRKKIDELIFLWQKIQTDNIFEKDIQLNIIGAGEEELKIKSLVKHYKLNKTIKILGNINNEKVLKELYFRSFASICLGQSGLSVVQALLHGVPFICINNCHSGGEIENIFNGITGYKCEDKNKIIQKMKILAEGKNKSIYSSTADYALKELKLSKMVDSFEV